MFFGIGWVHVRSSREEYERIALADGELYDELHGRVSAADTALFEQLETFLDSFSSPDLVWTFVRELNNESGLLHLASSRNHRGANPAILRVLSWIAANGPGSYGIVHVHDTESAQDNEFRVWRLRRGQLEELDDPLLSPVIPSLNPPGG